MLYRRAKELSASLFGFPYQAPTDVPPSVQQDKPLMDIVSAAYKTTINAEGGAQQTTIDPAERIRLQTEFKTRIYTLLEECLTKEPEHGPALLLYSVVAEYNTRAKDRQFLIELKELLLPRVDAIRKGSRAYKLIAVEIEGMGGNCFDKVERHLADFHYDLAKLYMATSQPDLAKAEYSKANKLCSKIYGRGPGKIKL